MTLDQLGLIAEVVIWTCVSTALLFIAWLAVAACCVIVRRRERVRTPTEPNPVIEVGDDVLAMIREARRADRREADAEFERWRNGDA